MSEPCQEIKCCDESPYEQSVVDPGEGVVLYENTQQSWTVVCPVGTTGAPVTATIPAGTVTSNISQAEADRLAIKAAITDATAALVCTPI